MPLILFPLPPDVDEADDDDDVDDDEEEDEDGDEELIVLGAAVDTNGFKECGGWSIR